LLLAVLCTGVTFINIYGLKYWVYLIPAILMKRPAITEWQPLPIFANDIFNGFRVLFFLVALILISSWRQVNKKNWPGLAMLVITALLAWRSRRHAPFFGVATLAFMGPHLAALLRTLAHPLPTAIKNRFQPAIVVLALYSLIAIYIAAFSLPNASLEVFAPVGHDPVREVDILSLARARGNLASPFGWGCYCSWRLAPRIKISMDGRYETTYPESTFELNDRFYAKRGPHWDQLVRDYHVDYVILDYLEAPLRPRDLTALGYVLIWEMPGHSALLCLPSQAAKLTQTAATLPPTTVNPLDAKIPDAWWLANQ
jgi:hypothetical protein